MQRTYSGSLRVHMVKTQPVMQGADCLPFARGDTAFLTAESGSSRSDLWHKNCSRSTNRSSNHDVGANTLIEEVPRLLFGTESVVTVSTHELESHASNGVGSLVGRTSGLDRPRLLRSRYISYSPGLTLLRP